MLLSRKLLVMPSDMLLGGDSSLSWRGIHDGCNVEVSFKALLLLYGVS